MLKQGLSWVAAGIMVLGLSGWCLAGEGETPKTEPKKEETPRKDDAAKQVDELRSVIGKLGAARTAFVKSNPELLTAQKQIQEKRIQVEKEQQEFYAKLRTLSPEIDALEKQREEIEAARKKDREDHKPPRAPKK
jgi:septal ring factor EnvC (AmiA/AmiB activator)